MPLTEQTSRTKRKATWPNSMAEDYHNLKGQLNMLTSLVQRARFLVEAESDLAEISAQLIKDLMAQIAQTGLKISRHRPDTGERKGYWINDTVATIKMVSPEIRTFAEHIITFVQGESWERAINPINGIAERIEAILNGYQGKKRFYWGLLSGPPPEIEIEAQQAPLVIQLFRLCYSHLGEPLPYEVQAKAKSNGSPERTVANPHPQKKSKKRKTRPGTKRQVRSGK